MKKYVLVFILFVAVQAQEKHNIAVMEFDGAGITSHELQGLSNRLRAELFHTGKYDVLERSRMNDILMEQGFQQTGCTNKDCAVEIGQLIGVQKIVVGSINVVGDISTVYIRMVDVGTGKIEKTAIHDCRDCDIDDIYLSTIKSAVRKLTGLSKQLDNGEHNIEDLNVNTNPNESHSKGDLSTLRITSNYRNARFLINNRLIEPFPTVLSLAPGKHSIVGKMENASDYIKVIELAPKEEKHIMIKFKNPYSLAGIGWYVGMAACIAYGVGFFVNNPDDIETAVGIAAFGSSGPKPTRNTRWNSMSKTKPPLRVE